LFREKVRTDLEDAIKSVEGSCGICYAVAEEVCRQSGAIVAYERPNGILERILDDQGNVIGEGFDVVWSHAVLAAEIDAGIIPTDIAEDLKKEGTNTEEGIELVADLYGYGWVISPAVIALTTINDMGGRTLCSLSALTNMLLHGGAQKILKPSPAEEW
jgi:hypothetical protein